MMKSKKGYATQRIKDLRTIARLSNFIWSIHRLNPGPVVIYARVSKSTHDDNLPDQITKLKTELANRGFTVIAVFKEVAPSWEGVYSEGTARSALGQAILKAKNSGTAVVAESVDRFRRSFRYQNKRKRTKKDKIFPPLTLFDLKRLMKEADGVTLATVVNPDAPQSIVRSYQTKRGQLGKENTGGRPVERFRKKAKRLRLLPKALAMRRKKRSYSYIADKLKTPRSTIRDWTKA